MTHLTDKVGVGLRHPHFFDFISQQPQVGWLEIHSENFFNPHSDASRALAAISKAYPISCHGIGLSLGSADPINTHHVEQLRALIQRVNPIAVSDHLSWSSINGQFFNDLLPLPYTEEALLNFCDKVDRVQNAIGRQMLIENPSSYLSFEQADYTEWDFLAEVEKRTGCGLLLDLNNIHVSAFNHQFDAQAYLDAINPAAVKEIHLAGYTVKTLPEGELWIDTHSKPVSEPVWALYRQWLQTHSAKHGVPATLIEWDSDIPALEVLLAEARKAEQIITEVCHVTTP
ncbi:DUF692 domain-containing protein [Thaumasiovibrio subtropicus]|uniref:MNIO family bufferin maturase n=1 Tax=Thaumasiovibrio subtropicus TaxID=1891207 RepID=UPI000B362D73|nr:DUF692 domain-containing protein [Thaumasiovibrio subtropicus]